MAVAPPDYWPCACVKHKSMGKGKPKQLVAIKMHAPNRKKCRVCDAVRPDLWDKPPAPAGDDK